MRAATSPVELDLDDISAEGNIRHFWRGDEAAKQLVASVRSVGVIEPVIVVPIRRPNGHAYRLIAGFRRYTAACEAGLSRIPAVVRTGLTDAQVLEIQLVENLQRLDMNPIEEAKAVRDYIAKTGLDQESAARRIGRSGAWVSLRLGLLSLPEEIQERISDGRLSATHGNALVPYASRPKEILARCAELAQQQALPVWKTSVLRLMGEIPRILRPPNREKCPCTCSCCAGHDHVRSCVGEVCLARD